MVCPECGEEVTEGQKFCPECGTAQTPLAPTEPVGAIESTPPSIDTGDLPDTQPVDVADLPDTQPVDVADLPDTQPVETHPIDVFGRPPIPAPITEPVTEPVTEPIAVPASQAADTTVMDQTPAATTVEVPAVSTTIEMPAVFDGGDDLVEYADPSEPFRVRIVFILSIFATMAVLLSMVADVIDLRTTRPAAGIVTGVRTLDDIGTNLGLAAFVGAGVMVLGALLACFGLRWGAGIAGGSGLALAGWAGLTIGLAELPIAIAESITRTSTSPEPFTLRVTRDVGWWLIAGVGVLGVLVFISSLRSIGTGAKPALNPLIAALTAVAAVILGFGPLVPVGDASFADNFRSTDPSRDLPSAFFIGRLGQVALIAVIGTVGMLLVRSYGLGLAAGAVTTASAMWVTSLVELGDRPIGIADHNPGATTTVPHAVTTVGMVATLALLAIAAALATYRLNRRT